MQTHSEACELWAGNTAGTAVRSSHDNNEEDVYDSWVLAKMLVSLYLPWRIYSVFCASAMKYYLKSIICRSSRLLTVKTDVKMRITNSRKKTY